MSDSTPIVICSVNGKCLPVLAASIKSYAPPTCPVLISRRDTRFPDFGDRVVVEMPNVGKSFGESYNAAIDTAFNRWPSETLYIANDDCVLTPTTISDLERDREALSGLKIGLLSCRADFIMWQQNIRCTVENDSRYGPQWVSEFMIKEVDVVAPVFASIGRDVWDTGVRIPPINWFSDDIWCKDLAKLGYRHFVSRAYVHHAGSQTIGRDFQKLEAEALEWVREHRPDLHFD